MAARNEIDAPPEEFRKALDQLKAARLRPEIFCEEMPAPQRIAPYSAAMTADVTVAGEDVGGGRLVLLYDPAGNDAWQGTFRCVAYARADIDPEMVTDPLLGAVGWSLADRGARPPTGAEFLAPSGTVTRVASESFGGMDGEPASAEIEVRASWSPLGSLTAHVEAWGDLLCTAAACRRSPPAWSRCRAAAANGLDERAGLARQPPTPTSRRRSRRGAATRTAARASRRPARRSSRRRRALDDGRRAASAAGTGPFAIDAERASGYRYSHRAYLIQLRRAGAGTALIDPIAVRRRAQRRRCSRSPRPSATPSGSSTPPARTSPASPSSACGPRGCSTPSSPAGCSTTRASGWPCSSRSCSASGCARSTPPSTGRGARSPSRGCTYAALDVELLVELRDVLADQLDEAGKREWAEQEFAPWADGRRGSRAARALAAYVGHPSGSRPPRPRRSCARMWELPRRSSPGSRDITTNRIVPDAAIIEAAQAAPRSRNALAELPASRNRCGQRYVKDFSARSTTPSSSPTPSCPPSDSSTTAPAAALVGRQEPAAAAARLGRCREVVAALATEHELPQENLVSPDFVRRLAWEPPEPVTVDAVRADLERERRPAVADRSDRRVARRGDRGRRPKPETEIRPDCDTPHDRNDSRGAAS